MNKSDLSGGDSGDKILEEFSPRPGGGQVMITGTDEYDFQCDFFFSKEHGMSRAKGW